MLEGITGKYAGAEIPMFDGKEIVLGRDPNYCNIVFDQFSTSVSRCHCSISFSADENKYYVTDYSKNGTFTSDGKRLVPNVPIPLEKGTVIYIGSRKDTFRLN
ncbi:MAG: FHA domain-containing protein [Oscillospiraceae bacterium]|nr:FHA domain-containing protein [Oscillospiraceae bacterium]